MSCKTDLEKGPAGDSQLKFRGKFDQRAVKRPLVCVPLFGMRPDTFISRVQFGGKLYFAH